MLCSHVFQTYNPLCRGFSLGTRVLLPRRTALTLVDPIWLLMISDLQTPSWQWYYPFHFAPFAADFEDVDKMDIRFDLGKPFQPFEQLMGVFPAARSVLHQLYRHYTHCDSPVGHIYQPSSTRS